MAQNANDNWELSSGLPDDFDFFVTSSRYGFDPDYVDSNKIMLPLLLLNGVDKNGEQLDKAVAFSLGKGWTPSNDQLWVIPDDEKKVKFNKNSFVGRWIERCMSFPGLLDVLKQRSETYRKADVWEGLAFHMKREKFNFPGLQKAESEHLMPNQWLGVFTGPGANIRDPRMPNQQAFPQQQFQQTTPPPQQQYQQPVQQQQVQQPPQQFQQQQVNPQVNPEETAIVNELKGEARKYASAMDFMRAVITNAALSQKVAKFPHLLNQLSDTSDQGFWAKNHA